MGGLFEFSYLTLILTGVLVPLICFIVFKWRGRPGLPPGPISWPLFGNAIQMHLNYKGKLHKYFDELNKQYGPVYRIYYGKQMYVVLNDVDVIREAFVKQQDIFSVRPSDAIWAIHEGNKSGTGTVWANGELWKAERGMIRMCIKDAGDDNSFIQDRILKETENILAILADFNNDDINVYNLVLHAGIHVINVMTFGSSIEPSEIDFQRLVDFTNHVARADGPFNPINIFPYLRFLPPVNSKLQTVFKKIDDITNFILKQVVSHEKSPGKGTENMVDKYLTMKSSGSEAIPEKDMLKSLFELHPAGTGSLANTLDWGFLYLILNPEVQTKCQEEIDKETAGSDRFIRWADAGNMKYVQATIYEIQRLASVTALSVPHTLNKDSMVQGYVIPQEAIVVANIYSCHRQEQSWVDPMSFKPERFLDESGELCKPAAFMPFSIGPRSCPGEFLIKVELFIILSNILRKFKVSGTGDLCVDGFYGINLFPPNYSIKFVKRT